MTELALGSSTTRSTIPTCCRRPTRSPQKSSRTLEAALDRFRKVALSLQPG
jgi:hypothetical protein